MIDDSQMDFYSTEDNSSNSKDGLNHLKEPSLSNMPHTWEV